MSAGGVSIRIEPEAPRWAELVRSWWSPRDAERVEARRECGLPTDRPIILTGHQAEFWHPGILAKFMAAQAAGESLGGATAWLIADQDDNAGSVVSLPTRGADGTLRRTHVDLNDDPVEGVPTGARPAIDDASHGVDDAALPSVIAGFSAIRNAMRHASDAPTLAHQIARALGDLSEPWLAPAPSLFATEFHRSGAFSRLVGRMRSDARACVEAYNRAAGESLEAGIAPLELSRESVELPLWRVRPGTARRRVFAHDIDEIPGAELAPRALLMTAFVRSVLCDLFIHGTGGAAYDRVTERWIELWLGRSLAPATMVTGDVLLPLQETGATDEQLAQARWRAHHARHDPAMLGEPSRAEQKMALVAQIDRAPRLSEERAEAFGAMQALLASYRTDRREGLESLDDEVRRVERAVGARAIALDRTWAFPLHEQRAIDDLHHAVARAIRCAREDPCCR